MNWRRSFVLVFAVLCLHIGDVQAEGRFLDGRLLVASKKLQDPNFNRTVVYLVEHDRGGAVGLIVNRRIGEGNLAGLLKGFGLPSKNGDRDVKLHFGGPVASGSVFILHSSDYSGKGTLSAKNGLSMTGDRAILEAISAGRGPKRMKFMVGYSGWGPGQLENEIARGDWLDATADLGFIFEDEGGAEEVWQRAKDKAGLTL